MSRPWDIEIGASASRSLDLILDESPLVFRAAQSLVENFAKAEERSGRTDDDPESHHRLMRTIRGRGFFAHLTVKVRCDPRARVVFVLGAIAEIARADEEGNF